METIEAIRDMNDKHPAGRRSTCIDDLCARVEALEKENKELRDAIEQARQGPGEAVVPVSAPFPSDAALIAYIETYPRRSLAQICERFGVAYDTGYGYTEGARKIRKQLQRLRRVGRIRTEGQRWMI